MDANQNGTELKLSPCPCAQPMEVNAGVVLFRPANCQNWTLEQIMDYLNEPYGEDEMDADVPYLMQLIEEKRKDGGSTGDNQTNSTNSIVFTPTTEPSAADLSDFSTWPTAWVNESLSKPYDLELPLVKDVNLRQEDAQDYHYLVQVLNQKTEEGPKPPEIFHEGNTGNKLCPCDMCEFTRHSNHCPKCFQLCTELQRKGVPEEKWYTEQQLIDSRNECLQKARNVEEAGGAEMFLGTENQAETTTPHLLTSPLLSNITPPMTFAPESPDIVCESMESSEGTISTDNFRQLNVEIESLDEKEKCRIKRYSTANIQRILRDDYGYPSPNFDEDEISDLFKSHFRYLVTLLSERLSKRSSVPSTVPLVVNKEIVIADQPAYENWTTDQIKEYLSIYFHYTEGDNLPTFHEKTNPQQIKEFITLTGILKRRYQHNEEAPRKPKRTNNSDPYGNCPLCVDNKMPLLKISDHQRNLCIRHFFENWQYLTPTDRLSSVPVSTNPKAPPQVSDKVTQTLVNTTDENAKYDEFGSWTTERIQNYLEEFYFYGSSAFDEDQIVDEYKEEFAVLVSILEQRKQANSDPKSSERGTPNILCRECNSPCLSNNFCSKCSSANWQKVKVYRKAEDASRCLMEMRERFTKVLKDAATSNKQMECIDKDCSQLSKGKIPTSNITESHIAMVRPSILRQSKVPFARSHSLNRNLHVDPNVYVECLPNEWARAMNDLTGDFSILPDREWSRLWETLVNVFGQLPIWTGNPILSPIKILRNTFKTSDVNIQLQFKFTGQLLARLNGAVCGVGENYNSGYVQLHHQGCFGEFRPCPTWTTPEQHLLLNTPDHSMQLHYLHDPQQWWQRTFFVYWDFTRAPIGRDGYHRTATSVQGREAFNIQINWKIISNNQIYLVVYQNSYDYKLRRRSSKLKLKKQTTLLEIRGVVLNQIYTRPRNFSGNFTEEAIEGQKLLQHLNIQLIKQVVRSNTQPEAIYRVA
jgi:hypothetical protein